MKRFFWIFLMAGTVFLIWHNSMQDQVHSERASFFFVTLVQPWLAEIGRSVPAGLLDHIVRKTAHVFEYTVLGLVLYSGLGALMEHNRKVFWAASASGLLTAAIDESIQMFSPGRGPQLSDVGIDFCGVLLGCFLGYLWKRYKS
jgi:VanZ family protein